MVYRYFLLFLSLFVVYEMCGQTKRAVIIGIGQQEDNNWGKINGDKDVPFILRTLCDAGYQKGNIVTLVNEQATKKNIVMAFGDLAKRSQKKDIVYIHFSGHGQRVTDINGDEKDGWDEAWIPYDACREYCDRDRGEKHLIDDEIYKFLKLIKKKIGKDGKMLVTVDACHSGGSTFGIKTYSYGGHITIRGVPDNFVIPSKRTIKKNKMPEDWLTLSACKSHQYNQEMQNPRVGILTYALYSLARKGNIRMEDIENFIKKNKGPYPQTPVLIGETGKYSISDVLK